MLTSSKMVFKPSKLNQYVNAIVIEEEDIDTTLKTYYENCEVKS